MFFKLQQAHEKDPPRIRRKIKNTNQNYLSWSFTKTRWNKMFLSAKEEKAWKIFENHGRMFQNHDIGQK